jgi:hypothetical protein
MTRTESSLLVTLVLTSLVGCAGAEVDVDEPSDADFPEAYLEPVPEDGAFDGADATGPSVTPGGETEVWAIRNQWDDTDTTEARRAGLAWGASSGLTWEEKFDRWVASFTVVPRAGGWGNTVRITTPFGDRAFDAPTLECAEVALFLRATFAAWYGLPFYVQGWDSAGRQTLYAGHFGFINARGERIANFPRFRTAYADHTSRWSPGAAWPSDSRLRGLRLGTDDAVTFLSTDGTTRGAGAYFDEIHLNKRVGYFLRLLLLYFGSTNLADPANTFAVTAEGTNAGDMLLHRWQRRGIGHVMPIFRRTELGEGRFELAIASGSMPRRQPSWQDPTSARREFLTDDSGGPGNASDGSPYATLGGGVRRWRTPVYSRGRWRLTVRSADRASYIPESETATIAGRPARLETLLAALTPEERRDAAVARIEAARMHLRTYPSSCSARQNRENGFAELYDVMADSFGEDRREVDRRFRTLEDRVFSELTYEASRTCCWNSSTAAMQEIVMAYAEHEQAEASARGMCVEPTPFRAEAEDVRAGGDGYGRWFRYASSIGRAADWRAWREDEPCAQRTTVGDTLSGRGAELALCEAGGTGGGTGGTGSECEAEGAGGNAGSAARLTGTISGRICAGDEDWFRVDAGTATRSVIVTFTHSAGDLDVAAVDATGRELDSSAGTTNEERVSATGTFYVRVFGYSGAANTYSIRFE